MAEPHRFRYRVDRSDALIWVDPWWLAFAQENSAPELTEECVLGRPLWDFVEGEEPCEFYRKLHARIREKAEPVVLPFRCDSPSLQRHMQMIIRPEGDRELAYDCRLNKVVPQREIGLLVSSNPRVEAHLTVCSCCKRGLVEQEGWLELDVISERLLFSKKHGLPHIQYAVCSHCAQLS